VTATKLENLLRRDRALVLAAVLASAALAWAYILWLSARMIAPPDAGMAAMPGMDAMPAMAAMAPALQPWSFSAYLSAALMWIVMMIGMMLPAAAPTILLYARVGRAAQHRPFAATGWFVAGYLIAWTLFSLAAALGQAGLSAFALLTPMLRSANDVLGGSVLAAAGLYQFSPFKALCLEKCQSPLFFIQQHGGFRPGLRHCLLLGFRHGLYCVGCCWVLMLLLFVGGVMNIAWIAALSVLVLLEKLLRNGRLVARLAGAAALAGGLFLLQQGLFHAG
jgi:predicted metal-binding membrane protein